MKRVIFLVGFSLVFFPLAVFGGVEFSEVMYDLPGADTGREWVEIYNNTSESEELANWKLFETDTNQNTNHALVEYSGGTTLLPQGYAIIADDPNKFKIDWPAYTGTIFSSSFSLKNTGEFLGLKNEAGDQIDSFNYTDALGANGDGSSLQKVGNVWKALSPTPGGSPSGALATSPPDHSDTDDENDSVEQTPARQGNTSWPVEPQVFASITSEGVVITGAGIKFTGKAFGIKKEPLTNARYSWNFGDGASAEGEQVTHIYDFPGEYLTIMNASSGDFSGSARTKILVIPSDIAISEVVLGEKGYVSISNPTRYEIDLSFWQMRAGTTTFMFPENSRILSGAVLKIASSVTKLVPIVSMADLLYPNSTLAFHYPRAPQEGTPLSAAPANFSRGVSSPVALKNNPPLPAGASLVSKASIQAPAASPAKISVAASSTATSSGQVFTAAVASAITEGRVREASPLRKVSGVVWIAAALGLILIGAGSVFFIGKKQKSPLPLDDVSDI